jgi:class 3 adenylate cyclase
MSSSASPDNRRNPVRRLLARMGLRFADAGDEAMFQAEHAVAMLPRQRFLIGLALVVFLVYAVRDIAIGPTFGYGALYFRLFVILPILAISFAASFSEFVRPQFQVVFTALLVVVIAAIGTLSLLYPHYGPTDPAQTNRTMSTMMLILGIMALSGLRFGHAVAVGLIAVLFWFMGSIAKQLAPDLYPTLILNVVLSFVIGALAAYWLERAERAQFLTRQQLKRERERSADALYSSLPRHVVERIVRNDRPISEAFVEAVVVLADLEDFNTLTKRIGHRQTVEVLDDLFSAFDELAEKRQLQRLRTVGDSYVVVGGTFEGLNGGVPEAAEIALDILKVVEAAAKRFDLPLAVRIGVHVGPLIGGVVGRTSPIYDFWGDTFNVVAELQRACKAGGIHCSENFYWRAGHAWKFEENGTREFEGIGTMKTFYLAGAANTATSKQEAVHGA